jgi:VIT1/CCC1 family predicted Fe2+/Mn2+ transporter
MMSAHEAIHKTQRVGWLRAAVLGANDGIISISSLMLGVTAAQPEHAGIMIAGTAGLVAGAMSMAAGEYVSVHSQADTEKADLAMERRELKINFRGELKELTDIYIERGLEPALATEVAKQLTAHDALEAHARDEIGISKTLSARPLQAAFVSALSFSVGGLLPVIVAAFVPSSYIGVLIAAASLVFLLLLGVLAAKAGGAPIFGSALRVTFWGALAMAVTAGIGILFRVQV